MYSALRTGPFGYTYDIYGYDLDTHTEFPVCTARGAQRTPRISGNKIVWSDERHYSDPVPASAVYGYDLQSHSEFLVGKSTTVPGIGVGEFEDPWLVWSTGGASSDIYGVNVSTLETAAICTASGQQLYPSISGDTVVWLDYRHNTNGPPAVYSSIYAYSLANKTERRLAINSRAWVDQNGPPKVSGDMVVWSDLRNSNPYSDLYGYDLARDSEFELYKGPLYDFEVSISGDIAVWSHSGGPYDIYGCNISGLSPIISTPSLEVTSASEQARVQMHAHWIDDIIRPHSSLADYTISEEELLDKYRAIGYDFAFVTEHDPVFPGTTDPMSGAKMPSMYTRSSESTRDHHLLVYGTRKPIRVQSGDLGGQLDAAYVDAVAPGFMPFAAAAHPNQYSAPWPLNTDTHWGWSEIAAAARADRPIGVEVCNGMLSTHTILGVDSFLAFDKWEYALLARKPNVFAVTGDDYTPTPAFDIALGTTSVMVPGVQTGMPATDEIDVWNERAKAITSKLRAGSFYASVGAPIRFNRLKVVGREIVAETAERCTIEFWGADGTGMQQQLKREEATTQASYCPQAGNRYVYVRAAEDGRMSISQAIWVDGEFQQSAAIPGGATPLRAILGLAPRLPDTALSVPDATLTVPTQSAEMSVTIRTLPADERPLAPPLGYVSDCLEIGPTSSSLSPPGTLSVATDVRSRQLYGAGNVAIFRFDAASGSWEELPSVADKSGASVEASIGDLGTYALSARDVADAAAPSISFVSIVPGQTLSATRTVEATAADNVGFFKASFYIDDILLGDDLFAEDGLKTTYDFSRIAAGPHVLRATAEDASGNLGETSAAVTVQSTKTAPAVAITTPRQGASVAGQIHVEGTASPETSAVALLIDGNPLGDLSPSAGSFSFTGGYWPSGEHTITVRGTDAVGNAAWAEIAVAGPDMDTTAPSITDLAQATRIASETVMTVAATIGDSNAVSSALLFYRLAGEDGYRATPLTRDGASFEATIPASQPCTQSIDYYIAALDPDGNTSLLPTDAPAGHLHTGNTVIVDLGPTSGEGTTTIISRTDSAYAEPAGYRLCGSQFEITTTASCVAPIRVTIPYDPLDVSGNPGNLELLHYEAGKWVDCTVAVDTAGHTVTGLVTSLSPFQLGEPQGGPPAPIPDASERGLIILAVCGAGVIAFNTLSRRGLTRGD